MYFVQIKLIAPFGTLYADWWSIEQHTSAAQAHEAARAIRGNPLGACYVRVVGEDGRRVMDQQEDLERRVIALEKLSHEPFDFTDLVRRLEALEKKL